MRSVLMAIGLFSVLVSPVAAQSDLCKSPALEAGADAATLQAHKAECRQSAQAAAVANSLQQAAQAAGRSLQSLPKASTGHTIEELFQK